MAEFVVNTTQLESCSRQMAALQRELDAVAVKLGAMQLGSVLQIKASTALIARVGDCKWAAAHQSDDLGNLAAGLREIAELYATCEKNLADPKIQQQGQSGSSSGSNIWEENFPEWIRNLISGIGDLVDVVLDNSPICAFLSFVLNAYGNMEEYNGDLDSLEFWCETAGETAAGVIIMGLMGMVAAAVLPATWPALAIGAAGVFATWGVDFLVQQIFGKGINEIISDGVMGVGNNMGESLGNLIINGRVDEGLSANVISTLVMLVLGGVGGVISGNALELAIAIFAEGIQ